MKRIKSFQFTTEITPETDVILSGRQGHPLSMSLDDGSSVKTVKLDTESIIRLQTFLSDFLQKEEAGPAAPSYEPTGRAVAVMDGDTLDILRVFRTDRVMGFSGAESDDYATLCEKTRSIADIDPAHAVFIFFDTFDGCISVNVIRRILRACISYQVDFVRTGDFSRSRPMTLADIEAFTTIDSSIISRATRDVIIISSSGVYTLKSCDSSLERPSLFDDGSKTIDGRACSRKEVLSVLRDILEGEDCTDPYTDEGMAAQLGHLGYDVARRTVVKYREFLGFPKRSERRVRK